MDSMGSIPSNMLRRMAPWALCVLSGLLYAVGFADSRQVWGAWLFLLPLLWVLRSAGTWKRALALSWCAGLTAHLFAYHWLVHMLREFAHLPVPLAVLGYLLLSMAQSGNIALLGLLTWGLHRRASLPLGAAAPLGVVASELLYPLLFPSYLANSQVRMPWVTQIADLGGVVLVSGLVALVGGALFDVVASRRPTRLAAGALAALLATVAYSHVRIGQMEAMEAHAPKLKTAIVQANVGAGDKHRSVDAGTRKYRRMTDEAMKIPGIGLVVWPESGLNRSVPAEVKNLEGMVATRVSTPMIVGAIRTEWAERRKVWNTAFALDVGGDIVGNYDKTELLAFGEYVPGDWIFPGIYDLLPYTARFERGKTRHPLPVGSWQLSTDICYEDIIPSFIRKLMGPIDGDGTRPHAMVNLTNDSWYGPAEPPIHLALSTFRSIEHRRWLIRSTATGISAFIDASGRIVKQTGFETEETLVHDVPMITGGPTLYGRIGDTFGWLATAATLALIVFPRRRRAGAGDAAVDRAA